ncbi:MAG TPA: histidine kinase [Ktedonobacterales bacterium]|nr:histidine kinase [Ktedonobacterales bacterium]
MERSRLSILLASAIMIALGVAFVCLQVATPSDGARLEPGRPAWGPAGVVVTPLREQPGGLRPGDVVVAVDGVHMESWAQALFEPTAVRPQWQFGQTVTYSVLRDGAPLDVPVTLGAYPLDGIWGEDWSTIIFALVFALIAFYIVLRRPGELAPLLLLLSASGILAGTTWSFGLQVSNLVGALGFWLYTLTTSVCYLLFYIAGLHFALIFPRSNPLLAGRSWILWGLYAMPYALLLAYIVAMRVGMSNALDWLGSWGSGESALAVFLLIAAVAALTWSYRVHRDVETRKKIRWIVFGALLCGIAALLLWDIPGVVLGRPLISANALGLLILPFPITIAIAILRYRLFDIDTLLNRTLVYGGLTGIIVGSYVLIVSALGALFEAHGNLLIALIATGVIAVLFQPLRSVLQRLVDRLLFGERDNPYAVLSHLGRRLETALAPEVVLPTIVETIVQALKLPAAVIEINEDDHSRVAAAYGAQHTALNTFPLVYQSEIVGQLRVAPRAPDEPLTRADKRLLEDIAHQAGIAAHATRLTLDLQRSRERLVSAREEERRRLRRDLHDGLGPTLAGQELKVGAIRNLLTHDPAAADRLLLELSGEIETAIADIRHLVYALRPPTLDELGLVGALRAEALRAGTQGVSRSGAAQQPRLRVTVDAPESLPPLPAAVEVAVYRIASEALTNALRHAQASACRIHLTLDDALHVEISDDGVGFAAERRTGVGLISMRERAEELGGTCTITAAPGQGVRVLATLPVKRE